jgi:hypothetical protein
LPSPWRGADSSRLWASPSFLGLAKTPE